ncbi:hypothetical protein D187_007633 [Cystobacter fuscus DSM 2262]|uniref:Outer membrane beta-barrel protein n=1 Tax=Cystobacter fuscus (strain ATCC 25194 / DSM 2262 / NBRC 100088 / M29) TaxID=1242864 RepID=S9NZJ2_CYSF2|nr:hypothetical protein [Cystobacter fuscus]EPX56291.1 hypothetical protein D187_007633 [Cystobacter fuscus DSM 2262]
MSRLRAVAAVLTLGVPFAASAADITRVASSFEDDDPFGLFIDAGIEYAQRNSRIVRETSVATSDGKATPVLRDALTYGRYEARLNLDLAVGISRDVEFSFGLPLVLLQDEHWNTPANEAENRAYRWGLGNARFGLGWAIFNQRKDDTKPMWVARLDYEAPTAPAFDPSFDTAATNRTTVGDRVHKYTLSTALSRKIGLAEPYFKVAYTIPVRGPFAYSNCDNPGVGMGAPENCGEPGWSRGETGIQAPHVVGVTMGSEFQVGGRSARMLKLDARVVTNFVSAGRYYNELSGVLGKLLSSSEYLQLGGQLGATFQLNEYISFRGTASFLYNTDHALTAEPEGRDANDDGRADSADDRNPNFEPTWDQPGGRFYAVGSRDLRFNATINFTF